jgi:dTDP-N-acetylfucosamine:lipid II N-acetylfucosaminyltransferase
MNIHFSHDDKFLDSFIRNAGKFSTTSNVYVVFSDDGTLKFTKSEAVHVLPYSAIAVEEFLSGFHGIQRIFFHALTPFYGICVDRLNLDARFTLVWLFFGFEVFDLKENAERIFLGNTRKLLADTGDRTKQYLGINPFRILRSYKELQQRNREQQQHDFAIKALIQKVHYVGHFSDEDVRAYIRPLNPGIRHVTWNYFSEANMSSDEAVEPAENRDTLRILLGNSAAASNNHMDALHYVHRKLSRTRHFQVIVPLSYGGSSRYIEKVVETGRMLFGDQFIPLIDFIDKNAYYTLLRSIDVGIFYSVRPQAAGNINWFLGNNKPVVLLKENTLFHFYKRKGFDVLDTESFDASLSKDASNTNNTRNVEIMNMEFGEHVTGSRYRMILEIENT